MSAGVYKITCLPTGKIYVGSSVDVRKRTRKHILQLRRGCHDNPILQRAFRKYGEEMFEIECIEIAPRERVVEREQFYLDALQPFGKRGFNVCRTAESVQGVKRSAETRRKMSAGLKKFAATAEGRRLHQKALDALRVKRATRTHCRRGHAMTPENTYANNAGLQRGCRECNREYQRRKYLEDRREVLATRTHCSAGHELAGDNVTAKGFCRACRTRCLGIARAAFVKRCAEKTECGRGHDLTLPRAYITEPNGSRRCRECRNAQYRARDKRRRQKQREAQV